MQETYNISSAMCWNMSGHTLMGRPAARLGTMALAFSSYVVVCIIDKRRWLSLYGCYFVTMLWYSRVPYRNRLLGIKRYSTYDSTYERIIVGILPKYHISYNKYHSTYHDCIFPWHHFSSRIVPLTPLFKWDLTISIVSTL